jgi:DNA-binding CsgD family transcriptional regulator
MTGVDYGIPGVGDLDHGNHLCALYSGPVERDDLLGPFFRAGLREGGKCLCLIDQVDPQDVRRGLVDENDPDQQLRAGQLDVDSASSVYLESGRFSAEHMATFLEDAVNAAAEDEFPHMRVAGEMSWVLPGAPGADELFDYESSINHLQAQIPVLLMCMYDLELFGTSMLVDVMKTHPKVLVGTTVLDNPDYLTPKQYRETRRPAIAAQSSLRAKDEPTREHYSLAKIPPRPGHDPAGSESWESLTEAERRISRLVSTGLTNKLIAKQLSLSPHTVDAHLKHIFTKLGIHSRVELTVMAIKHSTGRQT